MAPDSRLHKRTHHQFDRALDQPFAAVTVYCTCGEFSATRPLRSEAMAMLDVHCRVAKGTHLTEHLAGQPTMHQDGRIEVPCICGEFVADAPTAAEAFGLLLAHAGGVQFELTENPVDYAKLNPQTPVRPVLQSDAAPTPDHGPDTFTYTENGHTLCYCHCGAPFLGRGLEGARAALQVHLDEVAWLEDAQALHRDAAAYRALVAMVQTEHTEAELWAWLRTDTLAAMIVTVYRQLEQKHLDRLADDLGPPPPRPDPPKPDPGDPSGGGRFGRRDRNPDKERT